MFRVLKLISLSALLSLLSISAFTIKEFDEKNIELAEFVFDITGKKEPECTSMEKHNQHIIHVLLAEDAIDQNHLNEIAHYAEKKGITFHLGKEKGLYSLQFSYNPEVFYISCDHRESQAEKKQLVITFYNKKMLEKLHREQPLLRLTYLGESVKAC